VIALLFAAHLFAETSFAEMVAKALHVPPAALERSIQNIGDKEFVTVVLKWSTNERCEITKPCRGKWTVERSPDQFPPSSFNRQAPLAHSEPFYLLLVATNKRDVPLWFGTIGDFRNIEAPPAPDASAGFSWSVLAQAELTIDIPKNIGATALRVYSPTQCGDATCFDLGGTAKLPVLP